MAQQLQNLRYIGVNSKGEYYASETDPGDSNEWVRRLRAGDMSKDLLADKNNNKKGLYSGGGATALHYIYELIGVRTANRLPTLIQAKSLESEMVMDILKNSGESIDQDEYEKMFEDPDINTKYYWDCGKTLKEKDKKYMLLSASQILDSHSKLKLTVDDQDLTLTDPVILKQLGLMREDDTAATSNGIIKNVTHQIDKTPVEACFTKYKVWGIDLMATSLYDKFLVSSNSAKGAFFSNLTPDRSTHTAVNITDINVALTVKEMGDCLQNLQLSRKNFTKQDACLLTCDGLVAAMSVFCRHKCIARIGSNHFFIKGSYTLTQEIGLLRVFRVASVVYDNLTEIDNELDRLMTELDDIIRKSSFNKNTGFHGYYPFIKNDDSRTPMYRNILYSLRTMFAFMRMIRLICDHVMDYACSECIKLNTDRQVEHAAKSAASASAALVSQSVQSIVNTNLSNCVEALSSLKCIPSLFTEKNSDFKDNKFNPTISSFLKGSKSVLEKKGILEKIVLPDFSFEYSTSGIDHKSLESYLRKSKTGSKVSKVSKQNKAIDNDIINAKNIPKIMEQVDRRREYRRQIATIEGQVTNILPPQVLGLYDHEEIVDEIQKNNDKRTGLNNLKTANTAKIATLDAADPDDNLEIVALNFENDDIDFSIAELDKSILKLQASKNLSDPKTGTFRSPNSLCILIKGSVFNSKASLFGYSELKNPMLFFPSLTSMGIKSQFHGYELFNFPGIMFNLPDSLRESKRYTQPVAINPFSIAAIESNFETPYIAAKHAGTAAAAAALIIESAKGSEKGTYLSEALYPYPGTESSDAIKNAVIDIVAAQYAFRISDIIYSLPNAYLTSPEKNRTNIEYAFSLFSGDPSFTDDPSFTVMVNQFVSLCTSKSGKRNDIINQMVLNRPKPDFTGDGKRFVLASDSAKYVFDQKKGTYDGTKEKFVEIVCSVSAAIKYVMDKDYMVIPDIDQTFLDDVLLHSNPSNTDYAAIVTATDAFESDQKRTLASITSTYIPNIFVGGASLGNSQEIQVYRGDFTSKKYGYDNESVKDLLASLDDEPTKYRIKLFKGLIDVVMEHYGVSISPKLQVELVLNSLNIKDYYELENKFSMVFLLDSFLGFLLAMRTLHYYLDEPTIPYEDPELEELVELSEDPEFEELVDPELVDPEFVEPPLTKFELEEDLYRKFVEVLNGVTMSQLTQYYKSNIELKIRDLTQIKIPTHEKAISEAYAASVEASDAVQAYEAAQAYKVEEKIKDGDMNYIKAIEAANEAKAAAEAAQAAAEAAQAAAEAAQAAEAAADAEAEKRYIETYMSESSKVSEAIEKISIALNSEKKAKLLASIVTASRFEFFEEFMQRAQGFYNGEPLVFETVEPRGMVNGGVGSGYENRYESVSENRGGYESGAGNESEYESVSGSEYLDTPHLSAGSPNYSPSPISNQELYVSNQESGSSLESELNKLSGSNVESELNKLSGSNVESHLNEEESNEESELSNENDVLGKRVRDAESNLTKGKLQKSLKNTMFGKLTGGSFVKKTKINKKPIKQKSLKKNKINKPKINKIKNKTKKKRVVAKHVY
jgi:hypothetical protein